jgi:hypothetical protein
VPICSTVVPVTPSSPAQNPAKDPSGDLAQLTDGRVNEAATNRSAQVLQATSTYPAQFWLVSVLPAA